MYSPAKPGSVGGNADVDTETACNDAENMIQNEGAWKKPICKAAIVALVLSALMAATVTLARTHRVDVVMDPSSGISAENSITRMEQHYHHTKKSPTAAVATVKKSSMAKPVEAGATAVELADEDGANEGDEITFTSGDITETRKVVAKRSILRNLAIDLDSPLQNAFPAGSQVTSGPPVDAATSTQNWQPQVWEQSQHGDCVDTDEWTSGDTTCNDEGKGEDEGCTPTGYSCLAYDLLGMCADGAVVPEFESSTGDLFNYPEKNCCVCGADVITGCVDTDKGATNENGEGCNVWRQWEIDGYHGQCSESGAGDYDDSDFTANIMCCGCEGGDRSR